MSLPGPSLPEMIRVSFYRIGYALYQKIRISAFFLPPLFCARNKQHKLQEQGSRTVLYQQDSVEKSMKAAKMDAEEEDVVVREIDVYLSPHAAQQLHLLQYPGMAADNNSYQPPLSARIKPRHNLLQLEHPLPDSMQTNEMESRFFDSQTIPVQTHMCLGQLLTSEDGNKQLHLVPLQRIHQMRPSFQHVNISNDGDETPSTVVKQDPDDDSSTRNKPVTFQRKESERAVLARMSTYAFQKASQDTEAWVDLEVSNPKEQLVDHQLPERSIWEKQEVAEASQSYVQSLNYLSSGTATIVHPAAIKPAPTTNRKIDIVAKLTTLLKTGSPIPYSILQSQVAVEADNEATLLSALNVCAVLVRGNWCLHSKFLPPRYRRERTFLLLLLQEKGVIHRQRLWERVYAPSAATTTARINAEQLLALLQQIGKRVTTATAQEASNNTGWVLQIADDDGFLQQHPETVQLHANYWKRQRQRFQHELTLYNGCGR